MTEVLLSKLAPPRMDKGLIDRPRLLSLLAGLENRKATLLLAPAGYGKTIAMLQAAENTGRALVWYQLDAYDNDPAVFIQCLVTGLQNRFPAFGKRVLQLIEEGRIEQRLRMLVTSVLNDLSLKVAEPLLLAMDDFHRITDPLAIQFTQELLEHLPVHVHVMIASRAMPPLSIARLKIAGEISTIGPEDLRFTGEEISAFLMKRSASLPPGMERALDQKLKGWPALVRLAADSGSPLEKASDNAEIYEYLAIEVLARMSQEAQDFLLKTAVLDVVTAEECDLLLARNDSATILTRLEKENLFLTRLAGAKQSYRYHQLFREFLLERLGPERAPLQRAAGRLARERTNLAAAVEYFAAAGADRELTAVLKDACLQAFRQGRWQTVQRWLELLPRAQITADPWLSLFQARVEAYRGRMEAAAGWVESAARIFSAQGDRTGLAESRVLQARILRYKGLYQRSLELLEEAGPDLQPGEGGLRFDLPLEKSISLVMTGRFKEAEFLLQSTLAEAVKANEELIIVYLHEALGSIYYVQGEYAKALLMFQKRLDLAPERDVPYYYTQDYIAAIYQEWGELDRAYEYARRSIAWKESLGLTETLPSAYFQLADIYLNRGELKNAEEHFRRAIDLIEKTSGERFYLTLNKAYLARCLREQGRLAEAQALVEETLAEAQVTSGLALAICQELGAPVFWTYGKKREAQEMLAAAITTLEAMWFPRPLVHAYAAASLFQAAGGDRAKAAEYARKTLELSARKNYCQSFLVAFDVFKPILQFGLEQDVETVFCQKVLARLGKRAVPLLAGMVKHPDAGVRSRLITPLGEIGDEGAIAALASLADDPEPAVRELAGETLARLRARISPDAASPPARAELILKTLGPFLAMRRGEASPITWRTAKTRDLLAFLAHQAGPVGQEVILEELWPEHEPEKARGLFHTSLYYLRQAMKKAGAANPVVYRNNGYALAPGFALADRAEFAESIAFGLRGETAPAKAYGLLEKAVALYRGDYLADLDYPWVLPLRENLRNLCHEARLWLARHYLAEKNYHPAIGHLRMLVEMNPLNEEPYRLLMAAQAGLGDTVAVQREYQALKTLLARELHLAPAEETQELYKRLAGGK